MKVIFKTGLCEHIQLLFEQYEAFLLFSIFGKGPITTDL